MKIDIKEIARKAGVSTATVSRTLSGKGPVKQQTRERIIRIAQAYNYKPNSVASSFSRQRTDTVGVILPELMDEFFMDLIHSIDEEAYKNNHYVMISSSHSQRNTVETVFEFMQSGRVDGVILMAPDVDPALLDMCRKSSRPVVLLNADKSVTDMTNFRINNFQGALSVVEHLIKTGYNKIGILKGPDGNCDARERFNGFLEAMEKNGIEKRNDWILEGDFTLKSGYYGFSRFMNLREKPQAIFFANDMMALGAYKAAPLFNVIIPDDIAVAGFDDIFLSSLITPRLTTIHVPITELGGKAVRYLLKMISGEMDGKKAYYEELSTGLVIGGSCGCIQTPTNYIL